ncbi:MAG: hypothetical protein F8N39_14285 [Clostridiaceae bacterium]|nr:hypothetical protein [Clostridiaceae bacterium]
MSKKDKSLSNVTLSRSKSAEIDSSIRTIKKVVIFFLVIFTAVGIYLVKQSKEKKDDKNLVGYTLKNEKLVDSCNLVSVEGFYLGKGVLKGEVHYIFQAEKNGEKSNNIDVTEKELEIVYVPSNNSAEKPGTVKAYTRTYTKEDKTKGLKTQNRYFYKVYIPEGTIKDCGELTTASENSDE